MRRWQPAAEGAVAGSAPSQGRAVTVLVLVGATLLMGSSFVAGKVLLNDGFAPLPLVGWRFVLAALATLPIIILTGTAPLRRLMPVGLTARDWLTVCLIGLLQTTGVMTLLFWAMQSISASAGAILLFTNPIWVALLGRLWLGEHLNAARTVGLLIGITGVAIALGGGALAAGDWTGQAIGLAAALCWSAATVVNKRVNMPIDGLALSFWQMLIGGVVVLVLAALSGQHWPDHPTLTQWGWFLWLAIPASTGSFGLWFIALRRAGATEASGFLFLAPLFAILLSSVLLATDIGVVQCLGALLIGGSIWLVNRGTRTPASATIP